jgi:hypothetical protein
MLLVLSVLIIALVALKTLIMALDAIVSTSVIAQAMRDLRLALCSNAVRRLRVFLARAARQAGQPAGFADLPGQQGAACAHRADRKPVHGGRFRGPAADAVMAADGRGGPPGCAHFAGRAQACFRAQCLGRAAGTSYSELAQRILELLVAMRTIRIFNREAMEEHSASTPPRRTSSAPTGARKFSMNSCRCSSSSCMYRYSLRCSALPGSADRDSHRAGVHAASVPLQNPLKRLNASASPWPAMRPASASCRRCWTV